MYNVIEFEDSALGIVRGSWLTPRKKECLWPPYKIANKFNKCLLSEDLPDENWPIHAVKRVLYETDNIQKAREKCKKAESESDLLSDTSEQCKKRRKRKPNNIFHSDTEEEDENYINFIYPNPPPDELSACKSKSTKQAKKTLLAEVNVDPQKEYRADASPRGITSPKSSATNDTTLTFRSLCSTPTGPKPSAFDKINDSMELIAKYIAGIQSNIKELKATQNDILLRLTSSSSTVLTNIALPDEITLPIKSIEDLGNIEVWLENEDNKENLVNNLSFIGGNNIATITRRILQRVFSSELALKCNWTGKNNKTSLKNLNLIPVIINAVRKNKLGEKATDNEITSFLTSWFRFARDRDGGRENRRTRSSLSSI